MFHSLQFKFVAIFLFAIIAFNSMFFLVWLPQHFEQENTRYSSETKGKFALLKLTVEQFFNNHQQFDNSKESLFNKAISRQFNLYNDWINITLYKHNGEVYFQKKKQNTEDLETYRDDIFYLNELVGSIQLDTAPAIHLRVEQETMKELSFAIIIFLIVILTVILFLQEYIIRKPLARLSAATKAIIEGDYEFNLPSANHDEIGELTSLFSTMKISLVRTHDQLQEEITLVKDLAEAFSTNEEQLRTIIENIADGLVIINDHGFIELFNPAFSTMLGYSENELKGKNISSIVSREITDDCDLSVSNCLITEKEKLVNQGSREVFLQAKNGNNIPIEITLNDYTVNTEHHFVALLKNISERKNAEDILKAERDRAQLYLDTAQVAIFSLNTRGQIILANKKACDIFGFTDSELTCKNWFELIPDAETSETLKETYQLQMKQQDEIPAYFNLKMQNKNNHEIILEWHNKILKSKNNIPSGIIISGIDITENHNSEIEKRKLRKQLLQSQKMEAIGQLTGGIAHDFNNILTAVMGYTEMLIERENTNPDQTKLEYLDLIYQSGERATELIQNMLTYSRGISAVKKQTLYLPGMVNDVMKMLNSVIPSSVEIQTGFNQNVSDITCDSISIQQVVMNLCINARDAMNSKGVISLNVDNTTHSKAFCSSCGEQFNGDYVELCISDNGPGIKKSDRSHLFEPFFSTKEVGKGSGMGLSVVHGILHEVGAHIIVDSEVGKGTSFKLYFPLVNTIKEINVA